MKMSSLVLGVVCLLGLSSSVAQAGVVYLETSLGPQYTLTNLDQVNPSDLTNSSSVPSSHGIGFNTRNTLGFALWPWLVVGGTLNYGSITLNRDVSTDATVPVDGTKDTISKLEYGPTVGFFLGAFKISGTFILGGNQIENQKTTSSVGGPPGDFKYTMHISSGFQISGSYLFNLSSKFKIGPTLVFRNVWYKSQDVVDNNDATNNTTRNFQTHAVDGSFEPLVTLAVQF